MPEIQASRRLVKSPPELWTEVSDAASLARHLGEVGEIRITRLEPETTVAWGGELASGTVELAPAGWGTSVTLMVEPVGVEPAAPIAAVEPEPEPAPEREPEPEAILVEERPEAEPEPTLVPEPKRGGWWARLFKRRTAEPEPSATDADRAGGAGETTSAAPPAESSSPAIGPARQQLRDRTSGEPGVFQPATVHPGWAGGGA
jgi:hypothetical protein